VQRRLPDVLTFRLVVLLFIIIIFIVLMWIRNA
jgi:hypothetical protein